MSGVMDCRQVRLAIGGDPRNLSAEVRLHVEGCASCRKFHEETLSNCDACVIFYGAGNELWLRRKLREIQKSPGYGRTKPAPLVCVLQIGSRTAEKERFRSHEA